MSIITIEQVVDEWKDDSKIDQSKLDFELIRTPSLHSKYLKYYIHFKQKLALAESKRNKMGFIKRKYFRGECDKNDLDRYGWSQWNGLKPSGVELNQLLEFDSDMNDLGRVVAELKTSVAGLEYIMNQIKGRDYSLKSMVDYMKFVNGN